MCAPAEFGLIPPLGTTVTGRIAEIPLLSAALDTSFIIYRKETLGGGNCLFHALLSSLSGVYRKSSKKQKEHLAIVLRSWIARYSRRESLLNLKSSLRSRFPLLEKYPYTNWDNTNLPDLYYQELLSATDLNLENGLNASNWHNLRSDLYSGVDYSASGIYDFLRSNLEVGQEVFDLLSAALGIDLYIVALYYNKVQPYYSTATTESAATTTVVALTNGHYEAVFFYDEDKNRNRTFLRPDRASARSTVQNLKTFFNVEPRSALKKSPEILEWSELSNLILSREASIYKFQSAMKNIVKSTQIFLSTAQTEPSFFYLYVANYLVNFLPQAYRYKFDLSEGSVRKLRAALQKLTEELLDHFSN
jgi:hypothetical protein